MLFFIYKLIFLLEWEVYEHAMKLSTKFLLRTRYLYEMMKGGNQISQSCLFVLKIAKNGRKYH